MSRWLDQTIPHIPETGQYGNCMQAALASLLNRPLAEVPHFHHDGCDASTFWDRVEDYLEDNHYLLMWGNPANTLSVASGPTVRGTIHTVIMRGDVMVHDPNVSRAGLIEETHRFYLVPNDPAQK
jgi:hypothetical protein